MFKLLFQASHSDSETPGMDAVLKLYISDTELSSMSVLEKQNFYSRHLNYTEMVKAGVYQKTFYFLFF